MVVSDNRKRSISDKEEEANENCYFMFVDHPKIIANWLTFMLLMKLKRFMAKSEKQN